MESLSRYCAAFVLCVFLNILQISGGPAKTVDEALTNYNKQIQIHEGSKEDLVNLLNNVATEIVKITEIVAKQKCPPAQELVNPEDLLLRSRDQSIHLLNAVHKSLERLHFKVDNLKANESFNVKTRNNDILEEKPADVVDELLSRVVSAIIDKKDKYENDAPSTNLENDSNLNPHEYAANLKKSRITDESSKNNKNDKRQPAKYDELTLDEVINSEDNSQVNDFYNHALKFVKENIEYGDKDLGKNIAYDDDVSGDVIKTTEKRHMPHGKVKDDDFDINTNKKYNYVEDNLNNNDVKAVINDNGLLGKPNDDVKESIMRTAKDGKIFLGRFVDGKNSKGSFGTRNGKLQLERMRDIDAESDSLH